MVVGKLLGELLRINTENPNIKFKIDPEILKAFSNQFHERSGILVCEDRDFKDRIRQIGQFFDNFLCSLGG